jgi:hypothetical protein
MCSRVGKSRVQGLLCGKIDERCAEVVQQRERICETRKEQNKNSSRSNERRRLSVDEENVDAKDVC